MCLDLVRSFPDKGYPPFPLYPLLPPGSGPLTPPKSALASGQGQMSGSKRTWQSNFASVLVIDWVFMKFPSATQRFLRVFV